MTKEVYIMLTLLQIIIINSGQNSENNYLKTLESKWNRADSGEKLTPVKEEMVYCKFPIFIAFSLKEDCNWQVNGMGKTLIENLPSLKNKSTAF